jgi:AsmA protein
MSAQTPRHLWRWVALAIVALIAALLLALAIYVHNLLQPERFTALLENDLAAAGLRLKLDAPAEPALFPHPGVQLQGFSLSNMGSRTPVLRANGAAIVVPWRALLHGEVAIERIEVNAPRVDLGELETLLARLPRHNGPPRLPTIATGIHFSHGMLTRNGSPLLFDFNLATGALTPGRRFELQATAHGASGRRLSATLATVPSAAHEGAIDFDSLRIAVAERRGTTLRLEGKGSWRGGENLTAHLEGTLQHRSLAPPAPAASAAKASTAAPASAPAADQNATDRIVIDVAPARGNAPLTVALKLEGVDAQVDLRLQPAEFDGWWTRVLTAKPGAASPPPPFAGTARAKRLDLGWLKATDISIDAGPDLAPASASTGAPPATATSVAH